MTLALVIFGALDRRSGGYSYDCDLVEYLRGLGHEVSVWSLPAGPRHLAGRALAQRLETESPDVVVFDALTHASVTRLLELIRPRIHGLLIAMVHHLAWLEDPLPQGKTRRKKALERRFLNAMDAFLFNSENTRQTVADLRGAGAPFRPSLVCRPPVSRVESGSPRPEPGWFLYLGNVVRRKNLHGLLQALGQLNQRRPELNWSLTVAGNPDFDRRYAAQARRLARRVGVEGRVAWVGRVPESELETLWRRTDVLTMPSFHEGWGMAHAEALARGIVSLAVPCGASPELLGNAALWSNGHGPRELSFALEAYLDDPALREDLQIKARLRGEALVQSRTGFGPLGAFLESLLPTKDSLPPFDFDAYLDAKVAVDSRALHPRVLATAFEGSPPTQVLELGGGTGSMAKRLRDLGRIGADTVYELVDLRAEGLEAARKRCKELFLPGNFRVKRQDVLSYCLQQAGNRPDLVVAHAFLDLLDADTAAQALARLGGHRYWLTQLFDGLTAWEPVIDPELDRSLAQAYHQTMDERAPGRGAGSSRSGRDWLLALPKAGFHVLDAGSSDWIVQAHSGAYRDGEALFLRSVLHFFKTSLSGRQEVDQAGLEWWLAVRGAQICRGEATLLAHQLDLAAELVRPS